MTPAIVTPHGPLDFSRRALVMGILNVTPDSFSDGGRHAAPADAIEAARAMQVDGADLIDVGGESTRPGAEPVDADEQIRRVAPVIRGLRAAGVTLPVSIDTRLAPVAAAALDAGADLVNDVSALRDDARMAGLIAGRGVPVVLMHMRGTPQTMQDEPHYADVVAEVSAFLLERRTAAIAAGIPAARILLDPGIGFGKRPDHNWELLRNLEDLRGLGSPLLVGTSRKRFIRLALGDDSPEAVRVGTLATVGACCLAGVGIVRVHEVRAARQVAELCARIRSA